MSSHKQPAGNRYPTVNDGGLIMLVVVAAVIIVLSGMLIALVFA